MANEPPDAWDRFAATMSATLLRSGRGASPRGLCQVRCGPVGEQPGTCVTTQARHMGDTSAIVPGAPPVSSSASPSKEKLKRQCRGGTRGNRTLREPPSRKAKP